MRVGVLVVGVFLIACGGGATATPTRAPQTATPGGAATPGGDANSPEALCGLLTGADWQQFGYVTGAEPTVTSDEPGTAICQYASGLTLEVYTHETAGEAAETFETVLENAPFDEQIDVTIPGAEVVKFDPDVGDDHAGIVVRSGNLAYAIYGLARDSAQAELTALAALVLQRGSGLI
jgi:hypothetical protein